MSEIHFLNIDLDLESKESLDLLVKELGETLSVMTHHSIDETNYASFETGSSGIKEIIEEYFRVYTGLSDESKVCWSKCSKREFNLGYESGETPNNYQSLIPEESLSKLVSIGGCIGITIYPNYA